jgi:hypothetical protein
MSLLIVSLLSIALLSIILQCHSCECCEGILKTKLSAALLSDTESHSAECLTSECCVSILLVY